MPSFKRRTRQTIPNTSRGNNLSHFLDEVEPDKETLGMSCNQADPDMQGITLRERLILDLSTEKKLDVVGLTICSGSRYAGGHVPSVSLDSDGDVCVDWFSAGSCDDADGVLQRSFHYYPTL